MGLYPAAARGASRNSLAAARRGYPTDLSDAEWSLIEPRSPAPAWLAGSGGLPEAHPRREIVNAIRYLVRDGRLVTGRCTPIDRLTDRQRRLQQTGRRDYTTAPAG